MMLCICAMACWIITVFSLVCLLRRKKDQKPSQVLKLLLLCAVLFLAFFYFPHRDLFQNAQPLEIHRTSGGETALTEGVPDEERGNTILAACNRLLVSRSVLATLFHQSNGAEAYIYFSGEYEDHAENYIAVRSGGKQAIVKKNGIVCHIWTPVDFRALLPE